MMKIKKGVVRVLVRMIADQVVMRAMDVLVLHLNN